MQQQGRRRLRVLAIAVLSAVVMAHSSSSVSAFLCPAKSPSPPRTLSMNCLGACPNAYSPCLYYANTTACSGFEQQHGGGDAVSVCIPGDSGRAGANSSASSVVCAIECLAPFSGRANDSWNLQLTTTGEGFVEDVVEQTLEDPLFRVVTRPVEWVKQIASLTFAPTTTRVAISGDALAIRDKLKNFTIVDKGSVVYVTLPTFEIFRNAPNLTSIMLENIDLNGLAAFPATLPKLETLFLANNRLEAVPTGISSLMSLKVLDLSQNVFKKIGVDELPKTLEELNFQLASLVEVPGAILKMPRLKTLDLSGNVFPPPEPNTLPLQLETLSIAFLSLRTLPEDVRKMASLKYLDIEWNEFKGADLTRLPLSLETLHVGYSKLQKLSEDFSSLTNLTYLDASENAISEVTSQMMPPNLKFLNLSTNALSTLSANTLPVTLETLDLSFNKVETLPDDFTKLQSLESLYLEGNPFSTFPAQVFTLEALKELTLADTELSDVSFTREQAYFLGNLTNFTIDATALATSCSETSLKVQNYSVCVTGAMSASAASVSRGGVSVVVYVLITVGAVVFLAGVALLWRRSRARRKDDLVPGFHFRAHSRSISDKKMFCLEDMDSDMILESPSGDHGMEYLITTSSAKFSSGHTSSTKSSRRYISVWDDEELLKWRVDAQQIHDIQLLASGFYGEVWLATYLGNQVAVKRMKKSPVEQVDRKEIQQFIAEIRLIARFNHPKIVSFVGVAWTMESDIQALVEYMVNGDLCSFISSAAAAASNRSDSGSSLSCWNDTTLFIAMDIAEALVYLHSLTPSVLHRDLKSRNVLLSEDLRAKLTDFGGSRCKDQETGSLASDSGTARWAAPEELVGGNHYSEAVDIYSLGVILSELDTFRIPYTELDIPEACLLSRVASGEIQPAFTDHAPSALVALARQCLAFNPASRPSAIQVAYQLRQMGASTGDAPGDATMASDRSDGTYVSSSSSVASSAVRSHEANFVGIL